jgi:3-phosphoshikimate 1-carboxyvinyltransferase
LDGIRQGIDEGGSVSFKILSPKGPLVGEIEVPGDKSISHRALIFGSIAEGETNVEHFLPSADTLATENCLRELGVSIEVPSETVRVISGKGLEAFQEPAQVLDACNSGTTLRILLGLLAGRPFFCAFTGDASLRKRPMKRVVDPLRKMGAKIFGRDGGNFPPLCVEGGNLQGIFYKIPVASAQVKSALMLAGLQAKGETILEEIAETRDHTERFFKHLGLPFQKEGNQICVFPSNSPKAKDIRVPGDFSSASFFLTGGLCVKGSHLRIKNVGLNPTRIGFLDVLKRMGANIKLEILQDFSHEPIGHLEVKFSQLQSTEISSEEVPRMIDELPIFAVVATQARGVSVVSGAGELRVKESDRISTLCAELSKMGADIQEHPDGFVVKGRCRLKGARVKSHGDHRLAMSLAIAALLADGETTLENPDCVDISFPKFFEVLDSLA